METRDSIIKKMEEEYPDLTDKDEAPPHMILKLFHADEYLQQAQIDVILQKIDNEKRQLYLRSEMNELKADKKSLRKLFIANNKIVKEHLSSTHRFMEKMKDHAQEKISLNQQIRHTRKELKKYPELKREMEQKVQEYTDTYVTFLERVAQSSSDFNSVQNVLNWYETLENCREDCNKLLKQELEEASHLKNEMLSMTEERSAKMRQLQNSLVMLKVRRKKAVEQRRQWEHIIARLKDVMSFKTSDNITLQTSCYDVYCAICRKRNKKPTLQQGDVGGQLEYIEKSVVFFKEVNRIATATSQIQEQQEQKYGKSVATAEIMEYLLQVPEESERHSQQMEERKQPRRLTLKQFELAKFADESKKIEKGKKV